MPYIPEEQLKALIKKISDLESWKKDMEKKLSFLNTVTIEGKGRITMAGGHLKVNSNIDTISINNSINAGS